MMFEIDEAPFGTIPSVVARHPSGASMHILPGLGTSLNALTLPNTEGHVHDLVLGFADSQTALAENSQNFRGAFLFPFPNRLVEGKYSFQNSTFQFDLNDGGGRQNALHGLLYNASFTVVDTDSGADWAEITTILQLEPDTYPAYPFEALISVTHAIHLQEGYRCTIQITNTGRKAMPFGIGMHPYYLLPDGLEACTLQLPPSLQLEVDDQLLLTGNAIPYNDFSTPAKFPSGLDHCFELTKPELGAKILVNRAGGVLTLWQDASFPYFQIYTSGDGRSAAIEAMSCPPQALQSGIGLITLTPDEDAHFTFGAQFS
jgi:aldose 1-epimerase